MTETSVRSPSADEFTQAYTTLLVSAWSDEAFAARLDARPREAAAEVGLQIPAEVDIRVVQPSPAAEHSLTDYHHAYEAGLAAGSVELIVPAAPVAELRDLNGQELAEVAGGGACCCCCPCCCSV